MKGCPRHPVFDRACTDARCQRNWTPEGAPTPDEQLEQWAAGVAVCPNTRHECCPDFACCVPKLAWPLEQRRAFLIAPQGDREKMMMGALTKLVTDAAPNENVHVTRGDPTDRK